MIQHINRHAPFDTSDPTNDEVLKWLDNRTIYEATMTERECAAHLRVTLLKLRRWRKRGDVGPPWFRWGRWAERSRKHVRYSREDVEAYLIAGGDIDVKEPPISTGKGRGARRRLTGAALRMAGKANAAVGEPGDGEADRPDAGVGEGRVEREGPELPAERRPGGEAVSGADGEGVRE